MQCGRLDLGCEGGVGCWCKLPKLFRPYQNLRTGPWASRINRNRFSQPAAPAGGGDVVDPRSDSTWGVKGMRGCWCMCCRCFSDRIKTCERAIFSIPAAFPHYCSTSFSSVESADSVSAILFGCNANVQTVRAAVASALQIPIEFSPGSKAHRCDCFNITESMDFKLRRRLLWRTHPISPTCTLSHSAGCHRS